MMERLLTQGRNWLLGKFNLFARKPNRYPSQVPTGGAGVDYNAVHASVAWSYAPRARRVLVVGCNRGGDCSHFVQFGAREVHGVDVAEEVGADYTHAVVQYHRCSAEEMPLADDGFDLVYCFATMEHIPEIERAFREMARVTAVGGVVYCVASPLWNSRFGHHKPDLFGAVPWIHLRMSPEEIVSYARATGISPPEGIEAHVEYMLHPAFFNKTPAHRYITVCSMLPGMEVIRNHIDFEPDCLLTPVVELELKDRGYGRTELLALTHTYIGKKTQPAASRRD